MVPSGKLKGSTSIAQTNNGNKLAAVSKRAKHHSFPMASVEKTLTAQQQMVEAHGKCRSPLVVSSRFAQTENTCFECPLDPLPSVPLNNCAGYAPDVAQSTLTGRKQEANVLISPAKPTVFVSDDLQMQDTPSKRMTFIKDDPALPETPSKRMTFVKDDPALPETPSKRMTFVKDDPALPETPSKRMTFVKNDPSFPETPSKRMTFVKDDPSLPVTPIRRTTFLKPKSAMPNTPVVGSPESLIPLRAQSVFGGMKLVNVGHVRQLGLNSPHSPTVHGLTGIVEGQDSDLDDHPDSLEEDAENIDPQQSVSDVLAARFARLRQLADEGDSDSGNSEENDCSFASPPSTHYESALSGDENDLSEDEIFEDSVASLPVIEASVKVGQISVDNLSTATVPPIVEETRTSEKEESQSSQELLSTSGVCSTRIDTRQASSDESPCSDSIEGHDEASDASCVVSTSDHSLDSLNDKPGAPSSLASSDVVTTSSCDIDQRHSDESEWHSPAQLLAQSTCQQMALHLPNNVAIEMQHRLSSTPLTCPRPPSSKGFVSEMTALTEMPSPIIGQRVDQATVTKVPRPSLYTLGPTWARAQPDSDPTGEGATFDNLAAASDIQVVNTVTVTKSKSEHIFQMPAAAPAVNPSKELFPSQESHHVSNRQCLSETKVVSHLVVGCDISGVQEMTLRQNTVLGKRSFAQSGSKARSETSEFRHPTTRTWTHGQKRMLDSVAPVARNVTVVKKVKASRTVGSVARSVSLTATRSSCSTRSVKKPGTYTFEWYNFYI